MLCSLSNLSHQDMHEISSLEKELGQIFMVFTQKEWSKELDHPLSLLKKAYVAFSFHNVKDSVVESLKCGKVKTLEKKLGVTLIPMSSIPA